MGNESGYEGEDWGQAQKSNEVEDNGVIAEMLTISREVATTALFATFIFILPFLIANDYHKKIFVLFTFENIVIFGGAFCFMIFAFWGSHNKEKIPEILEFKEPKFPKE